MDPDGSMLRMILLIILLALSAFFSASETALTSLSKIRLRHMIEEHIKGTVYIENIMKTPEKLLSTILICNTIVNATATSLATYVAIISIGNGSFAIGIATIVMAALILIFGELLPKLIASHSAEKIAVFVARPLMLFILLLSPVIFVLNIFTRVPLSLFGISGNLDRPLITEAEIKTIVSVGHEEGVIEIDEKRIINNVFEFGDYQAAEIMTPRTDIVAIDQDSTYDEIEEVFREAIHSRLPVYRDNIDNIIGILHLRDFIFIEKDDFILANVMRVPFFTYESKSTSELFAIMRIEHIPIAIVLDEYGGTSGLVTLKDLIEEIVGDFNDEYDSEDEITIVSENEFLAHGSTKLDDVNEIIKVNLESESFDSIGGYVMGAMGRIPKKGERIETEKLVFVIEDVIKNRVEKVRIIKIIDDIPNHEK